jgi:hypothetical protein
MEINPGLLVEASGLGSTAWVAVSGMNGYIDRPLRPIKSETMKRTRKM